METQTTQALYIGKAEHQAAYNTEIRRIYARALNKRPEEVMLADVLDDFARCR